MKAIVSILSTVVLIAVGLAALSCGDINDEPTGVVHQSVESGDDDSNDSSDDSSDNSSDDGSDDSSDDGSDDDSEADNPCEENSCSAEDHEVCEALNEREYVCLCEEKYAFTSDGTCAELGSFAVTPCDPNPCEDTWVYRTMCTIENQRVTCLCQPGYDDLRKEVECGNPCDKLVCNANQVCEVTWSGARCVPNR